MKKWELNKILAKKAELTQEQVNKVVDSLAEIVVDECRDNDEIIPLGTAGTFKRKVNTARVGRNPITGEKLDIPESHTIVFKTKPSVKKIVEKKAVKKAKK